MQLHVRRLELPHRGAHLVLDRFRAAICSAGILLRLCILRFQREHPLRREPSLATWRISRDGERLFERCQMLDVLAVYPLRDILERAHRLVPRLALGVARVRQREERDVRCEALHHARSEEAARLVKGDDGGQLSIHAEAAEREQPLLLERGVEAEQSRVFIGLVAHVDELAAGENLRADARRQMVDGRVRASAHYLGAARADALAEHLMSGVVAEERELGAAIHLRERLTKRDNGRVEVGRCRKRMSERRESARWH